MGARVVDDLLRTHRMRQELDGVICQASELAVARRVCQ